jgi:hypothetical protein
VTGALVKNLGISVPKTELQGGRLGRQGKETAAKIAALQFLPDDRRPVDCLHQLATFFAAIVLPPERRARADGCSVIRNSDREAR